MATMKEEKPYTCRVLSTSRKDPNVPPTLSFFISISISDQSKMRIKIPKLFAKSMQKRKNDHKSHHTNGSNESKREKIRAKPRNFLGSMVRNVFGNKKPQVTEDGKESNRSNKNDHNQEPFSRNGLSFFKRKTNKPCNGSSCCEVNGKPVGLISLNRIQSRKNRRVRSVQRKVIANQADQEGLENGDQNQEIRGEQELCKKRILMGEKCRPLNLSGVLHYDQNGVLLAEVLPDEEIM